MNPVALYFASGESLYPGAALLLFAVATSPCLKRRWLVPLRNVTAWLALAMVVMACPPFAWSADAIFLAVFLLWFVASNRRAPGQTWMRARVVTTITLALLLVLLTAVEVTHRAMPQVTGVLSDHLVVIGDSISSGIDPRVPAWPSVLQRITGVPVKNLSRPGTQVIEGPSMAETVTSEDRIVLIEIGGNDLLSGVPADAFEQGLEATLAKVAAPGRTVVMFELPLLPHKIAYGQIQRRLAAKYGVWLIPKRYFIDVIGGANSTSDGLHLSDAGARRMAALVAQVLSPALQRRSANP